MDSNAIKEIANQLGVGADYLLNHLSEFAPKWAAMQVAKSGVATLGLSGCTERGQVSYNLSQDADNFNVRRRVTVINMRSDKVLLQMEGCLSIETDTETNELSVIAELPNGKYQKHFIYLNDWTMYTVEQVDSTKTDKFNYEFNFLPQELPGVKITSKD